MAQNIIDISLQNPIKFRQKNFVQPAVFNRKYFDDHFFTDTVADFEEKVDYYQPWQKNETIFLHFLSNYEPHTIELWTIQGDRKAILPMTYIPSSIEISGVKVYEVAIPLASYGEGDYRFRVLSGNGIEELESEKICLRDLHENTIKFDYRHFENDFDMAYETKINPGFRVQGRVMEGEPHTDRVVFIDQPNNIEQLSAKTYYQDKLVIGDAGGTPFWVALWINEIFRCNEVLIDGKQYVIPDGAKWEKNIEENYPMAGWRIDIRPANIRSSKRFKPLLDPANGSSIVYNIDVTGFGPITGPASGSTVQIQNLD